MRERGPLTVFVLAWVGFFAAMVVWSLATPLMAAPDEPTHVAKAAAVVRGEWVGHLVGGPSSPDGVVRIPRAYADLGVLVHCYQFDADEPASCAPRFGGGSGTVSDVIYNARYQPLYYAVVGLPSLFTDSKVGIYLMRMLSAALSAVFLALAVLAAVRWSRSRLLLAGVLVATTPSVLFFGAVVNPTGLEVSAAIALWSSFAVLAFERLADPPPGLLAVAAVAASTEALVRPMSPFWVLLAALFTFGAGDWSGLGSFVRRRRVWITAAPVLVCGVASSVWIIAEHSLNVLAPSAPVPRSVGEGRLLVLGLDRTPLYFTEMVSRFGWLAAPSPASTYFAWTALIGLVVLLGLSLAAWRRAVCLLVLVVAVVAIPVVVSVGQAHRLGITWQGKDTLPLAVGVPILACAMLGDRLDVLARRLLAFVAIAWALATVVALYGNLRRDAVGDNGPAIDIFHSVWQPPLGTGGCLAAGVVTVCAVAALVVRLGEPPPASWKKRRLRE